MRVLAPGPPAASALRFGPFELDVRTGELRRGGCRLVLQHQPLQVLLALLEHPAELVSRDQLRRRLWPGDTFVDFEHGLNAAVKRLRDALGDSAAAPGFVETIPRQGYRFIAPVSPSGAALRRRALVAAYLLAALLAAALAAVAAYGQP